MSFLPGHFPAGAVARAAGGAVFSATRTDFGSNLSNLSNYLFANVDIGSEPSGSETRIIAIVAGGVRSGGAINISSITINSVTATVHANAVGEISSSDNRVIIASAEVPTGTNVTVTFVWTATADGMAFDAFRIMNPDSTVPHDTLAVSNGSPPSGTIDVPAGGILIAGSAALNSGTGTWDSGNPGIAVNQVDLNADDYYEAGWEVYATAQTNITVSRDQNNCGMVAASWR